MCARGDRDIYYTNTSNGFEMRAWLGMRERFYSKMFILPVPLQHLVINITVGHSKPIIMLHNVKGD